MKYTLCFKYIGLGWAFKDVWALVQPSKEESKAQVHPSGLKQGPNPA